MICCCGPMCGQAAMARPSASLSSHGTVNLLECGRNDARDQAGDTDGYARAATPVTAAQVWKAWVRAGSVLGGREVIAAEVEEIVDLIVSGEEALSLARRLESLWVTFPAACGVSPIDGHLQTAIPRRLRRGSFIRFICRSRRRVGWCEFSARLFKPLCFRCSTEGITSLLAAP